MFQTYAQHNIVAMVDSTATRSTRSSVMTSMRTWCRMGPRMTSIMGMMRKKDFQGAARCWWWWCGCSCAGTMRKSRCKAKLTRRNDRISRRYARYLQKQPHATLKWKGHARLSMAASQYFISEHIRLHGALLHDAPQYSGHPNTGSMQGTRKS